MGQAHAVLAQVGRLTRRVASIGALSIGSFFAFVESKNSILNSLEEHKRGFLVPLLPFNDYKGLSGRHLLSSKIHDDEKALIAKDYFDNITSRKNDISGLRPLYLDELDYTLTYTPEGERLERFTEWFEADSKNRNRDKDRLEGIAALKKELEKTFSCSMNGFSDFLIESMASTASCFSHARAYQIISTHIKDPEERKEALSQFLKSTLTHTLNRKATDNDTLEDQLKEEFIEPIYGYFSEEFSSERELFEEVFEPCQSDLYLPQEAFERIKASY